MDALTALGAVATASAILFYHLEPKHSGFVLAFAGASAASAVYGFVQGAWPFGVAEIFWVGVAIHRWTLIKRHSKPAYLLSKVGTPVSQPSRETPLVAVSSARCHAGATLRALPPSTYVLDSSAPRGLAPDTRIPGIEVAPARIASGY